MGLAVLWAEDAGGLGRCGPALLWGAFLPALSDELWLCPCQSRGCIEARRNLLRVLIAPQGQFH